MENSKQKIATEILPYLNEMANSETFQIVATTEPAQKITFTELMELSLSELETLQKIVNKAKTAKETKDKAANYDKVMKPKAIITNVFEKPKYSIIC